MKYLKLSWESISSQQMKTQINIYSKVYTIMHISTYTHKLVNRMMPIQQDFWRNEITTEISSLSANNKYTCITSNIVTNFNKYTRTHNNNF